MIYRVLLDGQDIYNPQDRRYVLLTPQLSMELNTAGSFQFTMHPSHPHYSSVKPLTSIIEVFEDGVLLWFGRPVDIKTDFFKQKIIYCEGALAFTNDSVQRVHEYKTISIHEFFRTVIANHNEQVDSFKRFTVGRITVEDKTVYRKLNYKSTFTTLKLQCLNAEGGYFFIRRENGTNYIDWLSEMPYDTNQPVEFGLNMLDASTDFDLSSFATCVLPLGDEVDGERLTVKSVNDGKDIIESEAIATYGRVVKCVEFSGVIRPQTLYDDGVEYLHDVQFDNLIIECTAAELHWQNENYSIFRIGQKVHAHSVPHLIDKFFNLMKMEISLDTAEKRITLGTVRNPTLTEITTENGNSIDNYTSTLDDINTQLDDIGSTIDDMTEVPSPDDIIGGIHDTLDNIDDLLNDDGFSDHIQDMLDNDELDDWLIDHGVDPDDLDDVTPEDVVELINVDLDDITDGLDDMTDYDDIGDVNDDLGDYWSDNEDIFNYDSGSSSYSDVGSSISETGSTITAASDPSSGLTEIKTQIIDLTKRVDNLRDYIELMAAWEKEVDKKLADLEELVDAIAKDAWVHEIDGERVEVGIVNFVTNV